MADVKTSEVPDGWAVEEGHEVLEIVDVLMSLLKALQGCRTPGELRRVLMQATAEALIVSAANVPQRQSHGRVSAAIDAAGRALADEMSSSQLDDSGRPPIQET